MKKISVLVTGSSGFLGKNVAEFLGSRGCKVAGFDISEGQDLLNKKHLATALSKVEVVCHLAAIGDVYLAASDPALAASVGVAGTANLVHVANELKNVKKIVYASTWEVYGHPQYQPIDEKHPCNPDHPYSVAKYGGELMLRTRLNDVPWVILRLGTAYGPYMRTNAVIPLFIKKAKSGEKITITGDGKQTRQFTHARDIARAFQLAIESKINGEVFNIISSEKQTIGEVAQLVKAKIPVEIEYTETRKADVPPAKVTAEKARKMLGWKPEIKFKQGFGALFSILGNGQK